MTGLIGKKIGMTSFFDNETGKQIPCTVIEAGPCVVTQVKTLDNDGYQAIQLGFGEKKEKNTTKPLSGHFEKASTTPKRKLIEFRGEGEYNLGDVITSEIINVGDFVSVTGKSKGKGFQGVIKRYGFAGSSRTHGQQSRERTAGSIGACSTPGRVVKGKKMAGRMGNDRVKQINLEVLLVAHDKNLIYVKGCVPGHNGSFLVIEK